MAHAYEGSEPAEREIPSNPEKDAAIGLPSTVTSTSATAEDLATPQRGLRAIRGGALRIAGYAAGMLVSLGTAAILVRHLGISGFGRFVTVTSVIALVGGVTEAGIALYGIREFSTRDDHDRRHLVANLLAMRLSLTAVGIACAVAFGFAAGYGRLLILGIVVAGSALLIQVVADVLSISLQARLELGTLAAVEFSRRTFALILIAALALLDAGLLSFLAAVALAGAASLVPLMWRVRHYVDIRLDFDLRVWRKLISETLPFAMAVSVAAAYLYVTVVLMSLISNSIQTGLFSTSFRIIQVVLAVPSLLLTAIFPLMTRNTRRESEVSGGVTGEMVGKIFTVALICGVWMCLAVVVGADFIIKLIAGNQGRGAVSVLRLQALVLLVSFISTSSVLGLLSLRRYRAILLASTVALGLDLLLGVLLIPSLGARGGAVSDVITEAVLALGVTVLLAKAVPRHGLSARSVPAVALAAGLSSLVTLAPIGSLAGMLGVTVVYFAVLMALHAIPDEITRAARRYWVPRSSD